MIKFIKELKNKFLAFYKNKYGMLIIVLWCYFIINLIFKFIFKVDFSLFTKNIYFNKFCEYVENNNILKIIIACITTLISSIWIIPIIFNKKLNRNMIIIYVPLILMQSILSWYSKILSIILNLIILIIFPLVYSKNWKRILLINAIVLLLQITTMILRDLSVYLIGDTIAESLLYQPDYYAMLCLLYCYNFKRKEK